MPIFINWFEADVSAPLQSLFKRDFDSWEDSHSFHERVGVPSERFCRFEVREGDKSIARTILFGQLHQVPDGFEPCEIDLLRERRVTERVIEFNLGQHLAARGLHVEYSKFGVTATQRAFRINDIGLCVETGIEVKSYYLHYRRQHGITLDWKVRQFFDKSLDTIPESAISTLLGVPVILKLEKTHALPEALSQYAGRYLGVVIKFEGDLVEVLCRDGQKRALPKKSLVPEAKAEVVASLAAHSKEQQGGDSVQRRILVLSHSLTPIGRRNVKILQDKLRSAIDFLNPNNRPAITVDFVPYCVGKVKVLAAPATASVQREQYV